MMGYHHNSSSSTILKQTTWKVTNEKMVNEVNYNTIALVIESWEQMKRTHNYEEVAGSLLFQQ